MAKLVIIRGIRALASLAWLENCRLTTAEELS